jgi:ribose/xylose/arabinose/galactoside ABC-type transport system permease subunit
MNMRVLPLYVTLGIFFIGWVICWTQFPNMVSTRVVGNLLTDNAYLGIVAVGMTLVAR